MDITCILKKKELYSAILNFLDSEKSQSEDKFKLLIQIIDDQEILNSETSVLKIFYLLSILEENHHRIPYFNDKLGLIFDYLSYYLIPKSSSEIINYTKERKRFLLLLFEHNIIQMNELIERNIAKNKNLKTLKYYLCPKVKYFLGKRYKEEIRNKFKENIESFELKIKQGENNSPICKLIREDSIDEFIVYLNSTCLPLTSKIQPDFYESNRFMIENETSLIE